MAAVTMARDHDPKYFLQVENRRRNVFVTQLGKLRCPATPLSMAYAFPELPADMETMENREPIKKEEEDENVSHIPIVHEAPSKILQEDRDTLQHTLRLQKQAEHDRVNAELIQKKQEFREQMEALACRAEEFARKEQDSRARALDFEPYIQSCEQKRTRALKKYQRERELTKIKMCEIQKLKEELQELKDRLEKLHKKVENYKQCEDFLQKITCMLPINDLESETDSVVRTLIKRHRTLLTTNQNLKSKLLRLQQNVEKSHHELGMLQEEQETAKVVLLGKISELQAKSYTLHETNEQAAELINYEAGLLRSKKQELSKMLLAISNMAEQCYLSDYGSLQEMPLLSKLDMIEVFILERMAIKQELMQSGLWNMTSQSSYRKHAKKKSNKRAISIEKL